MRTRDDLLATIASVPTSGLVVSTNQNQCWRERKLCYSRQQRIGRPRRVSWTILSIECRSLNVQAMWKTAFGKSQQDSLHCEVAQTVLGLFEVLAGNLSRFVEHR